MKVQHLVVDSGAFIKNAPIHEYAENIYSVDGAVKEIKDKATRQRLQFLPYKLQIKNPSPEAVKYVTDFSKKTGDYGSLSAVDMQILALTFQLEKEQVGTNHLNKEPSCQVTGKPFFESNQMSGFYYPKKNSLDEGIETSSDQDSSSSDNEVYCDSKNTEAALEKSNEKNEEKIGIIEKDIDEQDNWQEKDENVSEEFFTCSEEDNNSDTDEESWITPYNIEDIQKKMETVALDQNSSATVACISTDFSIQNVLLQMGSHVISVDGMLIKQARTFILRCYACYKTTNNTSKQFCPNCGNKTLKRVAVTINEDGTKQIHINFRKPINIRGKRYSLPTPKGGKHAVNPILCEDQPIPHNRPAKIALQKMNVLSPDYEAQSSPFARNDVYTRAASLGIRSDRVRNCKKNPNEWSKRSGNKKRK